MPAIYKIYSILQRLRIGENFHVFSNWFFSKNNLLKISSIGETLFPINSKTVLKTDWMRIKDNPLETLWETKLF